jgi:hypothetical protein
MATTVHEPPKIELDRLPRQGSGNGGWRNLVPAEGDSRRIKDHSPMPASTGIWVGLASIAMTFAAFTSALIVRQGGAPDWQHISLPPILYFNTLLIVASSITLEMGRRDVARFMGGLRDQPSRPAFSGIWSLDQRELLVLLRSDRSSRLAFAGRTRWDGSRNSKTEQVCPAAEHSGRHFAVLAFYGWPVAVFAFAALDEALEQ